MPLNRRIVLDDSQVNQSKACEVCGKSDCGGHYSVLDPSIIPPLAALSKQAAQTPNVAVGIGGGVWSFAQDPSPPTTKSPKEVADMIKATIAQQKAEAEAKAATKQFDIMQDFMRMGQIGATRKLKCEGCNSTQFTTDFTKRWIECKQCKKTRTFDSIYAEY